MSPESRQSNPEKTRREFLTDTVTGVTASAVGLYDGLNSVHKQNEYEKQGRKDYGLGFRLIGDLTLFISGLMLTKKGMEGLKVGHKWGELLMASLEEKSSPQHKPDDGKSVIQNGNIENRDQKEIK